MVLIRMVLIRPVFLFTEKDPAWSVQANPQFEKLRPES